MEKGLFPLVLQGNVKTRVAFYLMNGAHHLINVDKSTF